MVTTVGSADPREDQWLNFLSGYLHWSHLGEVISAAYATGLHEEAAVSSDVPVYLQELRKRGLAHLYGSDKWISTMLGRPPRLPIRYCALRSPLDLTGEELLLDPPQLEEALQRLDANGWSTRVKDPSLSRYIKIQLPFLVIREQVLEVSLGALPDNIVQVSE